MLLLSQLYLRMKKTTLLATCVFLVPATLTFLCSCGDETVDQELSQSTDEDDTSKKEESLADERGETNATVPVPDKSGTSDPKLSESADKSNHSKNEVNVSGSVRGDKGLEESLMDTETLDKDDAHPLKKVTTYTRASDESHHEKTMISGKLPPPVSSDADLNAADNEVAQDLLEDIDQKNRSQKTEIDKLKEAQKKILQRLADVRELNRQLKETIYEYEMEGRGNSSNASSPSSTHPPLVGELEKKVASLTHEVGQARKERHEHLEQIRTLQAKLDRIQGQSGPGVVDTDVSGSLDLNVLDDSPIVGAESPLVPTPTVEVPSEVVRPQAGGRLFFEAAITDAGGKTREAFYTEFFIVKQHLDDILMNAGFKLSDYEGINSYAELWARVRKNDFQYSQQQERIRKALLAAVDPSGGRRVFTDINGNSDPISGLPAGSYFIIGTASLGQVGVTWSLPVEIEPRSDKRVALTLENSNWSL